MYAIPSQAQVASEVGFDPQSVFGYDLHVDVIRKTSTGNHPFDHNGSLSVITLCTQQESNLHGLPHAFLRRMRIPSSAMSAFQTSPMWVIPIFPNALASNTEVGLVNWLTTEVWCYWKESNLHALRRTLLRRMRIPFRHNSLVEVASSEPASKIILQKHITSFYFH